MALLQTPQTRSACVAGEVRVDWQSSWQRLRDAHARMVTGSMLIKKVDLPEGLLKAQDAGTLVVFAGAGVSVNAPSKLPMFGRLADLISGGKLTRKKKDPIDRFLGQLNESGVPVHLLAKEILAAPDSRPNELHRGILSLFRSPDTVRVVTTNFDRHFSAAAAELYPSGIEEHCAPALPLGRCFHGLVYLHGSVQTPERMVLTDADFGRAYLTDGWATTGLSAIKGVRLR
jgi:hypothetical protein